MAFLETKWCPQCCKERPHVNGRCGDCSAREYREGMAAWQAKTTEEKLLDIHKRLLALEAGPARY